MGTTVTRVEHASKRSHLKSFDQEKAISDVGKIFKFKDLNAPKRSHSLEALIEHVGGKTILLGLKVPFNSSKIEAYSDALLAVSAKYKMAFCRKGNDLYIGLLGNKE